MKVSKVKKYKEIGKNYGLIMSDTDIMYLQAFIKRIAREEIAKAKK